MEMTINVRIVRRRENFSLVLLPGAFFECDERQMELSYEKCPRLLKVVCRVLYSGTGGMTGRKTCIRTDCVQPSFCVMRIMKDAR